jgi:hypothetical protein
LTYILRLINIYNTKENISLKILEGDKNVKKEKKITSLILCAALSAGLLTGCGSTKGGDSNSDVTELTVWSPQGNQDENNYYNKLHHTQNLDNHYLI